MGQGESEDREGRMIENNRLLVYLVVALVALGVLAYLNRSLRSTFQVSPARSPRKAWILRSASQRTNRLASYSRVFATAAATALLCLAVPAEAGCSKSVVMYNASWCAYCRQVRAILARNHIKYSILDATTPQVQAVMLKRFGDTAVPRTIIGGVLVEGVDEARIRQFCR